jgi:hypothetical protein
MEKLKTLRRRLNCDFQITRLLNFPVYSIYSLAGNYSGLDVAISIHHVLQDLLQA